MMETQHGSPDGTPLTKSDAKAGRWAGVLAFIAPAAGAGLEGIVLGLTAGEATAGRILGAMLGGAFAAVALVFGPLRRLLADLGALLVGRIPFVVFLLATVIAILVATAPGATGFTFGAAAGVLFLTVASGRGLRSVPRARLAGMVFILLLNVVLLVALDVVVRVVVLPTKSHNSIFIGHDEYLGWKLRPGFSIDRKSDVYDSRERINPLGFRTPERPFEKPAGVKRVLILGDSHSEGYTVNDDETYAARLEAILRSEMPVEVISLGVGGYSTDQELLAYVHYGRRYAPDLVVLQCAANDVKYAVLDRYWRGLKPIFRRCGETLLLEGVPVRYLRQVGLADHPLLRHSAIALVADAYLGRFSILKREKDADMVEAWKVTSLLVRDLAAMVRADGASMVMFDATPDDAEADAGFRKIAEVRGIPFIDILPAFSGDITRHRVKEDLHWNRDGHDAVARHLAPRLLELLRAR